VHHKSHYVHCRLACRRLQVSVPSGSVDENGDENGLRGEKISNRPPFSSPFSFTGVTGVTETYMHLLSPAPYEKRTPVAYMDVPQNGPCIPS
jgi:hypothetical protein